VIPERWCGSDGDGVEGHSDKENNQVLMGTGTWRRQNIATEGNAVK
jgi:hypothetical protein